MDTAEFAASFQALLHQQAPKPQPREDALLVPAPPEPEPDPFFEQYFAPPNDYTTVQPTYFDDPQVFDDHLLEETEEAVDVKITNAANSIYRAKRTGVQGLIASALVAVGGVLASLSLDAEIDWRLLGLSVGQAVLTAVITFLHNDKTASAE